MTLFLTLLLTSYLLGSLSTAILVCGFLNCPDPRGVGSGNPGATNVLRTAGKKAAAITLFGDTFKGTPPLLIGTAHGLEPVLLTIIAAGSVIGHMFPIFYKFRGGKGVATFLGVNIILNPLLAALYITIWLVTALVSRYSSLGAIVATTTCPLCAWIIELPAPIIMLYVGLSLLILIRHEKNCHNLLRGKEKKIGEKSKTCKD
jgi:glycerol-3-phosphate acyltransferase PlsY